MQIRKILDGIILPLYTIAIVSYFISLFRDYLIIENYKNYKDFFSILYVCSLSTLSIKSIIFMDNETSEIKYQNILFHLVCSIAVLIFLNFNLGVSFKIEYILLSLLWIVGSYIQRDLLIKKKIILSKSRDLLNTIFILLMLITSVYILKVKSNVILILILANCLSLIIMFLLNLKYKDVNFSKPMLSKWDYIEKLKNIFLTSIGFIIFYTWAINETNSTIQIFGYDKSLFVRVSFYFFAFFQVGSLALKFLPKNNFIAYFGIVFSLLIFFIYYLYLPKAFDLLIFPFACTLIDFSALLLTNKNTNPLYSLKNKDIKF